MKAFALLPLLIAPLLMGAVRDNAFTTNRATGVPAHGESGTWNAISQRWEFSVISGGGGTVGTNAILIWDNTTSISGQFRIHGTSNVLQFTYIDDFGVETPVAQVTSNAVFIIPNELSIIKPLTVVTNIVQEMFLPNIPSNSVLQTGVGGLISETPPGAAGQIFTYTSNGGRYSNIVAFTYAYVNGGGTNLNFDCEVSIVSNAWFRMGMVLGPNGALFTNILSTVAGLDFPLTAAQSESSIPVALSGAASGDVISLGLTNDIIGGMFTAKASNDTVHIRFHNFGGVGIDPPESIFRVMVTKFR